MMHFRFLILLFLLLAASAGSIADSQVYIWQRVWNDGHKAALRQSHGLFSTLRVLGLQIHPREGARIARVDTLLLQQDGRPVWLVVRLDGSLAQLDAAAILPQIQSIIARWRSAGVNLTAIEIDYDAPTSRLADYQHLLTSLRQALPSDVTLSITALPTWLSSPQLPALLAAVDSSSCTAYCRRSRGCLTRRWPCAGAGYMRRSLRIRFTWRYRPMVPR